MTSLAVGLGGIRDGDVSFLQPAIEGAAVTPAGERVRSIEVATMRALGDALRTDRLPLAAG
jgi:hypothetical protein